MQRYRGKWSINYLEHRVSKLQIKNDRLDYEIHLTGYEVTRPAWRDSPVVHNSFVVYDSANHR